MNFLNEQFLNYFLKKSTLKHIFSVHSLLPIILFVILLPHLSSVSMTIIFYIIFILLWFTLHTLGIIPRPGKMIQFFLVIIALVLLVINYGFIFSQKASLSLLSIMICLKLLEIQNELDRRNIFLIIFLSYFILVTYFLHSQSLFITLFVLTNIIILTLMLSAFNRKPQASLSLLDHFHLISRLFIKALPIAIILFLFFPRIPGPLWSLPEDGQSKKTGLSDKMFPGSVTNLTNSNEIAFRVHFNGPPPSANELYWRGPVLNKTDGFLWSQKPQIPLKKRLDEVLTKTSGEISYTVTLEPHQQKWLFTLEMPYQVTGDTINGHYFSTDLQLLNQSNIHQLTQYKVLSTTQFQLNQATKNELKESLVFPKQSNPKTYQLGESWKSTYNSTQQIVTVGLNYFRNKPFYYTRQPSGMIDNPSDQFLFDEQRGFCEHYASSFVLLMRAANIPARVVTGYQGIEKNNVGNYYVVRQSNAHAWAEVWIENQGWIRIDPTSMIPPSRIEADIFQTNLDRLSFSSLNLPDLSQLLVEQKTALYNLSQQLKQSIDNLKNTWNNWVLGYDQSKQNLFIKLMGFTEGWQTLMYLLIGSLTTLIILFQISHLYRLHQQTDKVYQSYSKFINKLNSAGMTARLSDGPEAIKQKAIHHYPEQETLIISIINNYIQIRYADKASKSIIFQFISQVKQFKPLHK